MVLPWVPATTSDVRPRMNSSASSAGRLVMRCLRSSTASTSGLPRESALPITTTSASSGTLLRGVRRAHGDAQRLELRGHRRVDVLVGAGDSWPRSRSRPASEAMAVPAIAGEMDLHATARLQDLEARVVAAGRAGPGRRAAGVTLGLRGVAAGEAERDRARRGRRAPRGGRPPARSRRRARGAQPFMSPKTMPRTPSKRARGAQLQQHAVDAVRASRPRPPGRGWCPRPGGSAQGVPAAAARIERQPPRSTALALARRAGRRGRRARSRRARPRR